MNNLSHSYFVKIFFFILLSCSIALLVYFSKFLWDSRLYDNGSEYILFLQQSKNIAKKDFTTILDSMKPKDKAQTIPQNIPQKPQKQEILESPAPKPIKLSAILNHYVLIDDKWYKLGDTISCNNETFKIQTIAEHSVKLISLHNIQNSIILEIFPKHDLLFFESFEH